MQLQVTIGKTATEKNSNNNVPKFADQCNQFFSNMMQMQQMQMMNMIAQTNMNHLNSKQV